MAASTRSNSSRLASTSAMSASALASMLAIPTAAACADTTACEMASPYSSWSRVTALPTNSPNRLSPVRRWWSRNDSGAPTVKECSHSDSLASSTAIGLRSTPNTHRFSTMRRTMCLSSSALSRTL